MSKLLATLVAALAIVSAQARENITIFYAWGPCNAHTALGTGSDRNFH